MALGESHYCVRCAFVGGKHHYDCPEYNQPVVVWAVMPKKISLEEIAAKIREELVCHCISSDDPYYIHDECFGAEEAAKIVEEWNNERDR